MVKRAPEGSPEAPPGSGAARRRLLPAVLLTLLLSFALCSQPAWAVQPPFAW